MPITSVFVVRTTIGLLAVGFLTLFAIVGATVWLGERAQTSFNEMIDARDLRGSAVELRDALRTSESSQRGYILTGNEIYLAPYDSAKATVQRQLDVLTHGPYADKQNPKMLERLKAVIADKIDEMDSTIALKTARRDAESLTLLGTNRGKALMDEANVFLYGIILATDERLTAGVDEQRANARMLRWVSVIGAVVIMFVVGVVTTTTWRYAAEIAQARDQVRILNTGLEERVMQRTTDLASARDRAEILLKEVNHRVANSLALVASLIRLQSNALKDDAAKSALAETEGRILAVAQVHTRLYSSGNVRMVALDEYLTSLLEQLQISMRAQGHGARIRHDLESIALSTDASINLGVVVTEWVTNAFKYAYPERAGEVRVGLKRASDGRAELVVEDDGIGRGAVVKGTGLGTRIVNAMASAMGAQIEYLARKPGTAARMVFQVAD